MFRIFIFLVIISSIYANNTKLRIPLNRKVKSPLTNYETYYTTNIQLGSPKQNFTVAVGIKKSDLWILSYRCTVGTFCENPIRNKFYEEISSTFKIITTDPLSESIIFDYKYLSAYGRHASESFQFGGFNIDSQCFLMADYVILYNDNTFYPGLEGMLGLGLISNAKLGEPLHYAIYSKINPPKRVFSLRLYNYPKDGYLVFGIDDHLYKGEINWISMASDKEYMFKAESLQIGDAELARNISMKLDTDSAYIAVPPNIYELIIPHLTSPRENFPNFIINADQKVLTLTYLEYTYMNASKLHIKISKATNEWVLGEPLFNKYYTIFDLENMKFGFAEGV